MAHLLEVPKTIDPQELLEAMVASVTTLEATAMRHEQIIAKLISDIKELQNPKVV